MKWKPTKIERVVGLFLLVAILAVIIAVIMINKWWESLEEYNYYTTEVKTKTGLAIDAGVYFLDNGWEIGRVVDFNLNDRNFIDVQLKVKREYCDRIREDSVASVTSFFGAGGVVNITIGHVPDILEDGRKIPSNQFPEGLALLQKSEYKSVQPDQLTAILNDITKLTTMLTDEHGEVRSLLRNVESITRQIRYGEGLIPSLYNSKAFMNKVGKVLDGVDQILKDVDDVVLIQNENINRLINEDVQRLITKLEVNLDIYTQEIYAIIDNIRIMINNSTGIINNLINESGQKVQILLNALSNQALRTLNDITTLINAILRDIALNTDPMLRNIVNQVFNTANQIAQEINHMIVAVSGDVTQLTHNLVLLTDQATIMLEDLDEDLGEVLTGLDDVIDEAEKVLQQVEGFVGGGAGAASSQQVIPRRQSSERLLPE